MKEKQTKKSQLINFGIQRRTQVVQDKVQKLEQKQEKLAQQSLMNKQMRKRQKAVFLDAEAAAALGKVHGHPEKHDGRFFENFKGELKI